MTAREADRRLIGGIDDATKCLCIGGIFIAGVSADEKTIRRWKRIGVKDSKLLSRKRRDEFEKIVKKTAFRKTVRQIVPRDIDNKTLNLNEWEMLACFDIIRHLKSEGLYRIYIDNWEPGKEAFFRRLEAAIRYKKVADFPRDSLPADF